MRWIDGLATGRPRVVAADNVGVHAQPADVLADPVDDEDVDRRRSAAAPGAGPPRRAAPVRARSIASAGTASIRRKPRVPVLEQGEPNGMRTGRERVRRDLGISSAKRAKPWPWKVSAPRCLPRPIAIILSRPLSTGPLKSVCGLTRLIGTMTSASSAAWRSDRRTRDRRPAPRRSSTVSMLDADLASDRRLGDPEADARTSSWPSAVAPPWLPIAGTTNGPPRQRRGRRDGRGRDLGDAVDPAAADGEAHPQARPDRPHGRRVGDRRLDAVATRRARSRRCMFRTSAQRGQPTCRNTAADRPAAVGPGGSRAVVELEGRGRSRPSYRHRAEPAVDAHDRPRHEARGAVRTRARRRVPTSSSGSPSRRGRRVAERSSAIRCSESRPSVLLGRKEAGGDRVDPHTLRRQLAGEVLGEVVEAGLGDGIGQDA